MVHLVRQVCNKAPPWFDRRCGGDGSGLTLFIAEALALAAAAALASVLSLTLAAGAAAAAELVMGAEMDYRGLMGTGTD